MALSLLTRKFAPLSPEVVQFVQTCPADRLAELPLQILDAATIDELHLSE